MNTVKKTAVFGGTFNPPHIGHRAMLEGISKLSEISKILIMPAKTPPHKSGDIVSPEHRVNMCRIAFDGVAKAEVSLDELSLEGKNYTLKTLEYLKEKGVLNPVLVIGADSLVNFHKWYCYEKILTLAELYVYGRDGILKEQLLSATENLKMTGGRITLLDICPPAVSSSEIRAAFSKKEDTSELLNPLVLEYIKEHSLYKG